MQKEKNYNFNLYGPLSRECDYNLEGFDVRPPHACPNDYSSYGSHGVVSIPFEGPLNFYGYHFSSPISHASFSEGMGRSFGKASSGCRNRRRKRLSDLKVVTMNTNSFSNLVDCMLPVTNAHVVFVQELKLRDSLIESSRKRVSKLGYKGFLLPCTIGPSGGPSSGVGILIRSHLDAGHGLADFSSEVVTARVLAIPIRLSTIGIVVLYSVYLETCSKLG